MPQGEIAPEPWRSAMEKVNAVNPHTGKASMNRLAEMSGVHPTTVQRVVYGKMGKRGASPETVRALATTLNKSPSTVARWLNQAWSDGKAWTPPETVNMLSRRQLKALDELINSMAESNRTVAAEVERQVRERLAAST